ncbi:MAG: ribosome biogenesis GTPase YlqF [Lachnospiraceae bacterium]|nr:ribosome biogenesis GTPase YlqF [Lachnospiraceae bacterium]
MNVQWYPGHMTKARRAMQEQIRLIDLVIELTDARLPMSGRNPDLNELSKNKARLLILNKADLADPEATKQWSKHFEAEGIQVLTLDSRKNTGTRSIDAAIAKAVAEKTERDRKRGILNRSVKVMVVGIPNVGKSTFINSLVKRSAAKTGDKPGVTKGNQWIQLKKGVDLLDTPGVLWPKIDDPQVGIRLALVGTVNDMILDTRELSMQGLEYLKEHYPGLLADKYGLDESLSPAELLQQLAENRKLIKKGAQPDTDRAASMFLDDLRGGKIGRITFEWPEEEDGKEA